MNRTSAQTLAEFASRLQFGEVGNPIVLRAAALFEQAVGDGLSGATTLEARTLFELAAESVSKGTDLEGSSTFAPFGRLPAVEAAAFNAGCTHLGMQGNTSDLMLHRVVVPAVLVAAELAGASLARLLAALLVGVEIGCRLANAVTNSPAGNNWSLEGIAGRVSAAIAAATVLGGGTEEVTNTLGLATTQGAGLTAAKTPASAAWVAGNIAGDGLLAALLGNGGWQGPADPLDGRRGLFKLLGEERSSESLITGLGREWTFATTYPENVAPPVLVGHLDWSDNRAGTACAALSVLRLKVDEL